MFTILCLVYIVSAFIFVCLFQIECYKMRRVIMLSLLLSLLVSGADAGRFLVWLPLSSRSVKIGVMTVGEELARRGHQVTVVSSHPYKTVPPGVTDIVIDSEFDKFSNAMTEHILTKDVQLYDFSKVVFNES